jgi:hypothetical protein
VPRASPSIGGSWGEGGDVTGRLKTVYAYSPGCELKLPWHLAAAPGIFCLPVERTPETRKKEVNESKPLYARAPAFFCVNKANPGAAGPFLETHRELVILC